MPARNITARNITVHTLLTTTLPATTSPTPTFAAEPVDFESALDPHLLNAEHMFELARVDRERAEAERREASGLPWAASNTQAEKVALKKKQPERDGPNAHLRAAAELIRKTRESMQVDQYQHSHGKRHL